MGEAVKVEDPNEQQCFRYGPVHLWIGKYNHEFSDPHYYFALDTPDFLDIDVDKRFKRVDTAKAYADKKVQMFARALTEHLSK